MISWFKKHFIPHIGNDHRPHILRGCNIRNIVIIILFLEIFAFLIPAITRINMTGGMATVLPAVLAQLTNEERHAQNLQTLTVSSILNEAAKMKAEDMATKSYFAHTSPEGKTPWYWLEKVGYEYQYAGENLAINFNDSKDVTEAWMNSPTHKANIVKGNYTEIGTGIATGIYKGRETVFVAQVYANPIIKAETEIKPAKAEPKTTQEAPAVITAQKATDVLGAETITNAENNPDNIVIDKIIIIDQDQEATFWQKIFASPRNSMNIILYVIFGIIFIALILYIFIKMRNHSKDLITNGLIVLAIIGAIFVANYYFSHRNMIVTESFDYSNEVK